VQQIVKIMSRVVKIGSVEFILAQYEDLGHMIDTIVHRMQRHFQATLTNSLSHERITPLN
jgi:hypothetical protein